MLCPIRLDLVILLFALVVVACSPDADQTAASGGSPDRSADQSADRNADQSAEPVGSVMLSEPAGWRAKRLEDERPSVILVVLDTLRADAVSAHGMVEGTTPHLDALAAKGLRYSHAYAPAPWTVSSHASLFTGLRVDQHGVGLEGLTVMPDSFETLAEDFQNAGYATASFAENALIHAEFGLERGFDQFEAPGLIETIDVGVRGGALTPFRLVDRIRDWNRNRDKSQPYFLFVNIFDSHDPYEVRDENDWVTEGVPREELEFVSSKYIVPYSLCDGLPIKKHLDLFRGLYLGDVASADEKLGALLRILEKGEEATPRIVVATSDHGEHLGENRLMGHRFSVRNAALHIPMIVTGIRDTPPAVIDEAVELRSLRSSLRCWALGESCSASLPIEEKSGPSNSSKSAPIFSLYSDSVTGMPDWLLEHFNMTREQELPTQARAGCSDQDPVFGEMVSMIRYPMKLTWFSKNEMVLHDLRWDPAERSNQMEHQPELAASLRTELEAFVRRNVLERESADAPELSKEAARRLKQLGYIQ